VPRISQAVEQVTDDQLSGVGSTPPSGVSGIGGQAGASGQAEMELSGYDSGQAFMGTCPDCGSQLEYAEGCVKCHVCGFSECG
jgi:ribonucleoside-diphosphate reductase alpha chain